MQSLVDCPQHPNQADGAICQRAHAVSHPSFRTLVNQPHAVLFTDDTQDNYNTTQRTSISPKLVDPILGNLHELQTQILWGPEPFEVERGKEWTEPRPLSKQNRRTRPRRRSYVTNTNYGASPQKRGKINRRCEHINKYVEQGLVLKPSFPPLPVFLLGLLRLRVRSS